MSILIGAYKPDYFEEALRSALDQTYRDVEVIVVDDSGGASVSDIIDAVDDPRVTYIRNPTTLGPAGTYARALEAATNPVVGILNDDDIWRPHLVSTLVSALESSPSAVVAFADHHVLVDDRLDEALANKVSRESGRDRLQPGLHQPFLRAAISGSVPLAVAALFRRSALGNEPLPTEVGGAYDIYLSYRLCRDGAGVVFVPKRVAAWRAHAAGLTSQPSPSRAEEVAYTLKLFIDDPRLGEMRKELNTAYSDALWFVSTCHLRWGSRLRAAQAAVRSLRYGNYKAALLLPASLAPRHVLLRQRTAASRGDQS